MRSTAGLATAAAPGDPQRASAGPPRALPGNDIIQGGPGSDYLNGGYGNDSLSLSDSTSDNAVDAAHGGPGTDRFSVRSGGGDVCYAEWGPATISCDGGQG